VTRAATVVVLTYNGERYLDALITAVEAQDAPFAFDVLAIDSGSTDRTLEILRGHPSVQVHAIPNVEFGHGRTRNLGMSLASGEVVAFLVQDAVPASERWLVDLLAPFDDEEVGCAYGLQVPRADCCIAIKDDVRRFFDRLGPRSHVRVDESGTGGSSGDGLDAFFSDVNSAVRVTAWREVPFRDVAYAEDRALAEDMLAAGWHKAYTPFAAVEHSHDLKLRPYYRRMCEEFAGLRAVGVHVDDRRLRLVAKGVFMAAQLVLAAATDRDYRLRQKVEEVVLAPLYSAARYLAIRRSRKEAVDPRPGG
jgi:rhamnosyltransferase